MLSKLLTFSLVLFSIAAFAQRPVCGLQGGIEDEMLIKRLKENKRFVASDAFARSGNTKYVGIVFHDVQKTDGTGSISPTRFYDLMCNINEFYASQNVGLQFYLEEINVIKNTSAYENHTNANGTLNAARKTGFANIYVPENANPNGLSPGGVVLGYYTEGRDWIVLRPQEVNGFSTTLNHEMGHYLSLPHPFRGWDFEYYDPDVHGTQVGTYAPSTGFPFDIRNELEDGSNCEIAGDLICDTKPDYAPYDQAWGCNYNGGAKDPNGDEIDPDETNTMSYFGCSPETFTNDQIDLMQADVTQRTTTSGFRRLNVITPPTTVVGNFEAALSPMPNEMVSSNADIFFDWVDVTDATSYLIEIDRIQSFILAPQRFSSEESQFTYTNDDLVLDTKYYWRVKAADGYDLCGDWSPVFSFVSSAVSSVNTIASVDNYNIFPNPVQEGAAINLNLSSDLSFDADLEIINISGVQVDIFRNFNMQAGNNNYELDLGDLSAGVYFLKINSDRGTIQEKFIIQ